MQIRKKILFVSKKDGSANYIRYQKLKEALSSNYLISTLNAKRLQFRYFYLIPYNYIIFFIKYFFKNLLCKFSSVPQPIVEKMIIRAEIIKSYISYKKVDCLICQISEDLISLIKNSSAVIKIYDAPTCFADEIKYSGQYSMNIWKKLETLEKKAIESSNIFCTHWPTYIKYFEDKYKLKLDNAVFARWGCEKRNFISKFSKNPKIAFVGNLRNYWNNISLLNSLCSHSSFPIHVYGSYGKEVNKKYYCGYLKNFDKLWKYQFGLITISKDPLRKIGFSSKHLLYISYGLPVLCPEWRRDKILEPATVYYNEKNFNTIIKKYSQKSLWLKKHRAALRLVKELRWKKTLKPLVKEIDYLLKGKT